MQILSECIVNIYVVVYRRKEVQHVCFEPNLMFLLFRMVQEEKQRFCQFSNEKVNQHSMSTMKTLTSVWTSGFQVISLICQSRWNGLL